MVKITLDIDGMACGMCEAHVNNAVRNAFAVKKVTSSHTKGKTEILSEQPLEEEKLKSVIEATGYKVTVVRSEVYEKKVSPFSESRKCSRKKSDIHTIWIWLRRFRTVFPFRIRWFISAMPCKWDRSTASVMNSFF